MTDRMIDLSETPARLRVRNDLLLIDRQGSMQVTVPLADIAVLVLAHPQISCTHAVLSRLLARGGAIVTCDDQYLPVGLMLPIQAHFAQAERFAAQAAAPLPTRKRLWQQVVRAKLKAQSAALCTLYGHDGGIGQLIGKVRSGDTGNVESQAARRYWPLLFDDPMFRRRFEADDANRLLNYGYAILRAIVARAICAAGLHPSLGLHHHNRYNAFCLAADLMEPYRPIVDSAVVEHVNSYGKDAPLDRRAKETMLTAIMGTFRCRDEMRTLFDAAAQTASSLAKVFLRQANRLVFPEW